MAKFDFHTEKRNKKGEIYQSQPYVMHVIDGMQIYERPPQSGHFYNSDGTLVDPKDVPGKLQPKLRVSEKDQHVQDRVQQVVAERATDGVQEVREVESVEDKSKVVPAAGKKAEDKSK